MMSGIFTKTIKEKYPYTRFCLWQPRKSSGMSLERNGGLRTEQIADIINQRRLYVRKDGQLVTSAQVFAVVMHHPETFVKAEGRIMLLI